jgi:hypothetical protein
MPRGSKESGAEYMRRYRQRNTKEPSWKRSEGLRKAVFGDSPKTPSEQGKRNEGFTRPHVARSSVPETRKGVSKHAGQRGSPRNPTEPKIIGILEGPNGYQMAGIVCPDCRDEMFVRWCHSPLHYSFQSLEGLEPHDEPREVERKPKDNRATADHLRYCGKCWRWSAMWTCICGEPTREGRTCRRYPAA